MGKQGKRQAGRPKKYYDPVVIEVLKRIWTMLNLPCSKRLKAALPSWLPHYEAHYHTTLTQDERSLLNSISSATIDRLESDTVAHSAVPQWKECLFLP